MKFVVEFIEQAAPLQSLDTTRNAFASMAAAQKPIQQCDNGVHLTIAVNTNNS